MIVPVSLKGHINNVRGYPLMRKLLSIIFVAVIGLSIMLTGCESTQGAGERIGNDLKKTSKKVEKGKAARLTSPTGTAPQAIKGMASRLVSSPAGANW